MRLKAASVKKYRSIRDTGWFDLEADKTIMVGPNEAGKSAVLQALQRLNAPKGIEGFDALRDYPRSEYNDITSKRVDPTKVIVVEGKFELDDDDKEAVGEEFAGVTYYFAKRLDNTAVHQLLDAPAAPTYSKIKGDLLRLAAHVDGRAPTPAEGEPPRNAQAQKLAELTKALSDNSPIDTPIGANLLKWIAEVTPFTEEGNKTEEARIAKLDAAVQFASRQQAALKELTARLPVFVLFNNYFRVHPLMHLQHLADRVDQKILDDSQYDYGNLCLLKLLGFTPRELSDLGKAAAPNPGDTGAMKTYRDQLDRRTYQLNAASVRLTEEIRKVWVPDTARAEADRLRIIADGQYLKVVVEDDLGVEIELNQRSEGFQWLVSFFVVFFAEAADRHENAVLLLDEPGLSLHALKQREFRTTVSRLAETNQTIYTTHSPFLVGPDELDIVRVVEMPDRTVGTKLHTTVSASDPAALLPLQEALGYDLAQSLFAQQRNLVLEGLTDLWYIEATSELLRAAGVADLNEKIALVPAKSASRLVYYATILHAQKLKVAALLDSDAAGDNAAKQEELVHTLGNKRILRTKDAYIGPVGRPEIEDLLRATLIKVAKGELGWDVAATAKAQPARPLVDIFEEKVVDFSKYKLAKAYVRWTRSHAAADLAPDEATNWAKLIGVINSALK